MSKGKSVVLGRITGVFGLHGGLKIYSYCRPREAIFKYQKFVATQTNGKQIPLELKAKSSSGKNLVAEFSGFSSREQVAELIGADLSVSREDLPQLADGEFYWVDLIGLQVKNRANQDLGKVKEVFATGANDVLVVEDNEEEILIPLVYGEFVERVDLAAATIFVDWERDW